MKPLAILSTAAFFVAAALNIHAATPADVFASSQQLLVVTTPSAEGVDGRLQRFQRGNAGAAWQPVGNAVPIVVGKNGLAWGSGLLPAPAAAVTKREGDGKSPAGVFALGTSFGYSEKALSGAKLPYLALDAAVECVDDTTSQHYNRIVARNTLTPDWSSSERMRAMGESYRWGIVVDHNHIAAPASGPKPATGGGSCIFLHVWKSAGNGTAGCTAMAQPEMESLLAWLDPERRPLLVQLTTENYAALRAAWRLPALSAQP
jgi:D-alanyl-D-alanine dipeptidase